MYKKRFSFEFVSVKVNKKIIAVSIGLSGFLFNINSLIPNKAYSNPQEFNWVKKEKQKNSKSENKKDLNELASKESIKVNKKNTSQLKPINKIIVSNQSFIELIGPSVNLTLKEADPIESLTSLAELGEYGIIFVKDQQSNTKKFGSPVTLSFKNESFERAFNSVILSSGLQGKLDGKTIIIGENIATKSFSSKISKVYRLSQTTASYAADYLASLGASISKVTVTNLPSGNNSQSSIPLTGIETYGSKVGPLIGLTGTTDTRLQTITLVADNEKLINTAESYLKQIDLKQKQVALTVKILDVNMNNSDQLGNTFSFKPGSGAFIMNDQGKLSANFGPYKPPGSNAGGQPGLFDGATGENPTIGKAAKDTSSSLSGFIYPREQLLTYLTAQITSADTKILASPTVILTENPETFDSSGPDSIGRSKANEAMINVGNKVVTSYSLTKDESGAVFCEAEFTNAGLSLGARILKIDDYGFVTFTIEPRISAAVGKESVGNCGTVNTINERSLESGSVRVKNKSTLILTGVISETDTKVVSKWPILGDVPLLGNLFRNTSGSKELRELIIMVTPEIIEDENLEIYQSNITPKSSLMKEIFSQK